MFTGIVERTARVESTRVVREGRRLTVEVDRAPERPAWRPVEAGESIAVSGVCLTVTDLHGDPSRGILSFDAVPETVEKSTLGEKRSGDVVNIERSLRVGDLLGGHYVTGHIDGVGRVVSRKTQGQQELLEIGAPAELLSRVIPKGSIALDGISLTVVDVDRGGGWLSVAIIPFTLGWTTLGQTREGARINIETDAFGKWVLHAVGEMARGDDEGDERWRRLLERSGFPGRGPGTGSGGGR